MYLNPMLEDVLICIQKEHMLLAIEEIDKEGVKPGRPSSTYDVMYSGKLIPWRGV